MESLSNYERAVSSAPNAQKVSASFLAYNKAGKYIGWFELVALENEQRDKIEVNYEYADRNFTIKGNVKEDVADCSYKKGWNIVYRLYSYGRQGTELSTTKKPAGVEFKWYFNQR